MAGLILISQIQRSGGTLMARLFDGHPQTATLPNEMMFIKRGWPDIEVLSPLTVLAPEERLLSDWVARGYLKSGSVRPKDRMPFEFDMDKRLASFCESASLTANPRKLFDAYLESFFEAWGKRGRIKYHVAFAPEAHLSLCEPTPHDFFALYPDGHFITVVRNPESWLASAMRHAERYADFEWSLDRWGMSVQASLELAKRYPDRAIPIVFERFLKDTEGHMRFIAERVGLTWSPVLLEPTFNGLPVPSDSSFAPVHGIDTKAGNRTSKLEAKIRDSDAMKKALRLYAEARLAIPNWVAEPVASKTMEAIAS